LDIFAIEQGRKHIMNETELAALFGPAAPHSEHKRGETIRFTDTESGQVKTGEILWVCADGQAVEGGRHHPVTYVVAAPGFPAMVYPGQVIEKK
jgi:hypothetical protein